MDLNGKVGIFAISQAACDNMPRDVMRVMGKCIIIDCDNTTILGEYIYTAVCDDFKSVTEGELIPRYQVFVKDNVVSFVEIK
jgi:hypothetical protein